MGQDWGQTIREAKRKAREAFAARRQLERGANGHMNLVRANPSPAVAPGNVSSPPQSHFKIAPVAALVAMAEYLAR
jgi:hypothetical protein